jgi:hypothetical protein
MDRSILGAIRFALSSIRFIARIYLAVGTLRGPMFRPLTHHLAWLMTVVPIGSAWVDVIIAVSLRSSSDSPPERYESQRGDPFFFPSCAPDAMRARTTKVLDHLIAWTLREDLFSFFCVNDTGLTLFS